MSGVLASLPLDRVALAISAFRSDEAVIALLSSVFSPATAQFGAVIVVESLGSGEIAKAIAANGWKVDYHDSGVNLGSAGNLALRLRKAAATGLDWCLALNHDAELDPTKAARLVDVGQSRERVGAVYPQLRFTSARDRLDKPRGGFGTVGYLQGEGSADSRPVAVSWSSSNGSLYRLDPIRDGLDTWPELWMGYEDLAIGWEYRRRGWAQLTCPSVVVDDNYEFRAVRLPWRTIYIADKPAWYAYYQSRNLALIARKSKGQAVSWWSLATRLLLDHMLLIIRDQRMTRARLLWRGLFDGLRGRTGKGPVP